MMPCDLKSTRDFLSAKVKETQKFVRRLTDDDWIAIIEECSSTESHLPNEYNSELT
jgi:hypothetical protein